MPAMTLDTTINAYQRCLRNLPREHGFEPLALQGEMPTDLHGTLYFNGPGLFTLFDRPYRHLFDGDGAITAVTFAAGTATGAVRLVVSRELALERRLGRPLFTSGATLAPQWHRRLGLRFKNAANIKPLCWNERLFALFEAGLPTEIDPASLATIGETDLDGLVRGHLAAHFHAVPRRRAIYSFSVQRGLHPTLHLYELPSAGPSRRVGSIPLPKSASMLHDFVATERHFVFFIAPVRMHMLPILLGLKAPLDALQWRPQEGTTVIVVPIDAPENYRRFEVDPFFQYHFMNGFEDGDAIVVDFVRVLDFMEAFDGGRVQERSKRTVTQGRLFRAVVEPKKGALTLEQMWDTPCEFPQVTPTLQGREHRLGYVLSSREQEPLTRISKIRLRDGTSVSADFGDHGFPSDPIFVPRAGATAEDDGYLLSLVYDAESDRSHVAVLDAQRLEQGPIATAWFDHHIPRPLHSTWRARQAA